MRRLIAILSIVLIVLSSSIYGATVSHPLSQVTPVDQNLNLGNFNITASFFSGDGSLLTGIVAGWTDNATSGAIHTTNSSKNVGIGTASPEARLEINSSNSTIPVRIRTSSNTTSLASEVSTLLVFNNDTGTNNYASIDFGNSIGSANVRLAGVREGESNSELAILTKNGSLAERMRITNDGNVGIGISSPLGTLDVKGGKVSIANGGFKTFTANEEGFVFIEVDEDNAGCILYFKGAGNSVTEISDPAGICTVNLPDNNGNINIYFGGGNYELENTRGATRNIAFQFFRVN